MAQRNYLLAAQTALSPNPPQAAGDILETAGFALANLTMTTTGGGLQIPAMSGGTPMIHQTRRVAVDTALSGSIDLRHYSYATAGSNATIRVKLTTVTLGGSDVESIIGEADAGTLPTAAGTLQTLTIPIGATTLAARQRIYVSVFAVPLPTQTMGAGTVTFPYSAAAASTGDTSLELPTGMTWFVNRLYTELRLKRTAVNAIDTFFDLLETLGTDAGVTGVVNTVASGTQIQWTRTAGGTVLEWISPRFKYGWQLEVHANVPTPATIKVHAFESATAANCTVRHKLFRWRGAVETECFLADYPLELTTTSSERSVSTLTASAVFTPMGFQPDDRLVCRLYIVPVGTMSGGRTCTLNYDSWIAGTLGDCLVRLDPYELFFKAEADPPEAPIAGGQAMGGVGN